MVASAIEHSLNAGVFLRNGGQQVAFARVITDFATFAYLCDVFVVAHHRGQGLASHMIRALMDRPDLQTLRRWCLVTRDAHEVYEGLGFEPVTPGRWMEKKLVSEGWTDRLQS